MHNKKNGENSSEVKSDLEKSLRSALKNLEKASADLAKTQGYSKDTEKMKMLQELIKEQVSNENPRHPTR